MLPDNLLVAVIEGGTALIDKVSGIGGFGADVITKVVIDALGELPSEGPKFLESDRIRPRVASYKSVYRLLAISGSPNSNSLWV